MASSDPKRTGEDLLQRPQKRTISKSNSQPALSVSKKMKTENLSTGFHRKELTLRISMPTNMEKRSPLGEMGATPSNVVINVASPTLANTFKFYANLDSQSLPSMRRSESSPGGSSSMSQGCSSQPIRSGDSLIAAAGATSSRVTPATTIASQDQDVLHRARSIVGDAAARELSIASVPVSLPLPRARRTANGVPAGNNFSRRMEKYMEARQKLDDPEKKIRRFFKDLVVEVSHNPGDADVRFRLYQKNDTEDPLQINGRQEAAMNRGIQWRDFKYAKIQLQFFKPDETDATLRLSTSRIYEVTARSPCGLELCPCMGCSMCFRGVVCPFSAVQEYFCQASVVCASGYIKIPVLHIILSGTFYADEEEDYGAVLRELRDKSLADVGRKVLCQGLHSDFSLRCDGQAFACHKSILAAHSDVFAAMLSAPMAEVASNELVVEDMSSKGVDALLKFLYHGDIDAAAVSSTIAYELLKASHKYQILGLEKIAVELLHFENDYKFEIVTILEMFAFCGQVDLFKPLQDKAVRVLKSRSEELVDSDEYEELLSSNPAIAKELFKRVCLI